MLPVASLEKTLDVETDWTSISAEVYDVYNSSDIGRRLMAGAVEQLELEQVSVEVMECIRAWSDLDALDSARISENKKQFMKAMTTLQVDPSKPYTPRKEVKIEYRGIQVGAVVISPLDHYSLAVEALIRSTATELDLIPKLWCEDELAGAATVKHVKRIDEALLVQVKCARLALRDALADEDA